MARLHDNGTHECMSEDWLLANLPTGWTYDCVFGDLHDGQDGFTISSHGNHGTLFVPLDLLTLNRYEKDMRFKRVGEGTHFDFGLTVTQACALLNLTLVAKQNPALTLHEQGEFRRLDRRLREFIRTHTPTRKEHHMSDVEAITGERLLGVLEITRPRIERLYGDENALEIIGAVTRSIKQLGRDLNVPAAEIHDVSDKVRTEMMSGDYEHLLAVARRYFKLNDDEED